MLPIVTQKEKSMGGVQTPPKYKNMLPLKSRKKPYLKLNSYT